MRYARVLDITAKIPTNSETYSFTVEQVTSMLFSKLNEFAKAEITKKSTTWNGDIQWVITVPEAFNDQSKAAILNAAKISGLSVMALVHEVR